MTVAAMGRWPFPIWWTALFFALLAISTSLDVSLLEKNGPQVKSLFACASTDLETAGGETQRLAEATTNTSTPLTVDWISDSSAEDLVRPAPAIQPQRRRTLPYPARTSPRGSRSTSLSADPV